MSSGPAPTRILNARMVYRTEHPNGTPERYIRTE